MRYYVRIDDNKEILTESEFLSLFGNPEHRPYATKIYHGNITIDEVPEEYHTEVEAIVANKIARWGEYEQQKITSNELQNMIEEVL